MAGLDTFGNIGDTVAIMIDWSSPQPDSRFAEVDGIRLHYKRAGQGPAVLLLHGSPSSLYGVERVAELLQDSFDVIRPEEQSLAAPSRGRAQPAPTDHPGPRPHRLKLGNRLTPAVAPPPTRLQNSKRRGDLCVDRKV
jgi:hypothetical protein